MTTTAERGIFTLPPVDSDDEVGVDGGSNSVSSRPIDQDDALQRSKFGRQGARRSRTASPNPLCS